MMPPIPPSPPATAARGGMGAMGGIIPARNKSLICISTAVASNAAVSTNRATPAAGPPPGKHNGSGVHRPGPGGCRARHVDAGRRVRDCDGACASEGAPNAPETLLDRGWDACEIRVPDPRADFWPNRLRVLTFRRASRVPKRPRLVRPQLRRPEPPQLSETGRRRCSRVTARVATVQCPATLRWARRPDPP